ncbi:S-adenosylmethionine:tRNA ribosyltransferase-isomerase, partial [Bacillus nitratireducens]|uniref:S-adenosylmethionine:tRNA ribosyltransferase-isomerase n=1 Tax=Bacillus nitratireducens TaxID=2026193 RepID=UPI00284A3064
INRVKENGGRIITVVKTSRRMLEISAIDHDGKICATFTSTDIFIYTAYDFKAIDGLIKNFQFPKATIIMLSSAFSIIDNVLYAYNEAEIE